MDLTLVIPALNEAGNIGELITRARRVLDHEGMRYEILIVDGGSTDGTIAEAERAGAAAIRQHGRGYGGALRGGIEAARGDYVVTMDSDLSHEPEFIATLWAARDRSTIVIASRYVAGGRADMAPFRYVLSRILNAVFTTILRIPVKDISSGFRLYRRSAIASQRFEAADFDVLEEILIRLYVGGHVPAEVPFHYRTRKEGKSHAKLFRFAIAYLSTLYRMARLRYGRSG
ncbi:MAG: glycosyltransferase family 2 protein [bacterium]|nr:glycosyltransferase family 2 protein [bacterium]